MSKQAYGAGSIRERRKGYWEIRFMAHDPLSGKTRQVSRGFRGSKKEAQAERARLVSEISTGRHVATEGTFGYLLERWLAHAGPRLGENTLATYTGHVRNHLAPTLGEISLRKLGTADLDSLYARMERHGLKPATIHKTHSVARRALDQARRWHWIAVNPAVDASPPSVPKSLIQPPSADELDRLLSAAAEQSPEFGAFVRLAAATGARRGELCGLQWLDVDLAAKSLLIARSVTRSGTVKDTKTHAERRISLDAGTVAALVSYRTYLEDRAELASVSYAGPGAFMFSSDEAGERPWNPVTATHGFDRVRCRCGVTGVRLHDLRHWSVTQQLAAGTDVRTVAGRHGHANAATTLGVYAHFLAASDQKASAVMARLLPQ
jgi:integrase